MTRHIIRRLIQAIPTLFGVTLLSYLIMAAAPGGPAALLTFGIGNSTQANEARRLIEERWGLNDPIVVQYLTWLAGNDWMWWKNQQAVDADGNPVLDANGEPVIRDRAVSYGILRGDFGESIRARQPALDLILKRLPASFELGVSSLIVALVIGIPIGIFAAVWQGGIFDSATRILAVLGNAIPNFWFGLILLFVFAFSSDLLPTGNRCDLSANSRRVSADGSRRGCDAVPITERLEYMILPTIVLSYGGIAGYSRFMRTSMLDNINSDYIRTARAKGLRNRTVWLNHAARNSLIPIATFLGPAIVGVIGGAAITETIFTWPGLGLLFVESITSRDYPVVMAGVFISAILTIIAYIISDVLYALFDPRIRY